MVRFNEKAGHLYAIVEVKVEAPVVGRVGGDSKLLPPSRVKQKLLADLCIDGKVASGTVTVKSDVDEYEQQNPGGGPVTIHHISTSTITDTIEEIGPKK